MRPERVHFTVVYPLEKLRKLTCTEWNECNFGSIVVGTEVKISQAQLPLFN